MTDANVPADAAQTPKPSPLEISTSRQFPEWMAEHKVSFAFTTYEVGKLFLIGLKPDGRLSIFERTFNRCMGLCVAGDSLWMSSLYQLWRFENALPQGGGHEGFDRLYVPRVGYTTGDVDIHDIGVDAAGRPVFVNTLFSCLATVSDKASFSPLWKPKFISRLAAEDRCHLNGLAMDGGQPRYVTAVSQTDVGDGWRDRRRDGGSVIDVESGEIIASGLSMPHSPRVHDGRLWLHDSGSGRFGWIDLQRGAFNEIAFLPGYLRGLAFHRDFAIAATSRPRANRTFSGLALDDALAGKGVDARCGLHVIDLRSGDVVHWLRLEGIVTELYDVVTLPAVQRPMALGFRTDQIRRTLTIGEPTMEFGKPQ